MAQHFIFGVENQERSHIQHAQVKYYLMVVFFFSSICYTIHNQKQDSVVRVSTWG